MKHVSSVALAVFAVGTLAGLPSFAAGPELKIVQHIKMPDGGFDYGSVDSTNGRVYWPRDKELTMVDVKTGKMTQLVSGENGHTAVVVPGTDLVVVSHGIPKGPSNGIAIIDVKANKILADIPAGNFPDGATYDPASKLVYVMTHFDAVAYVVDPKTRKLVAQVPLGTKDAEFPAADGKGHVFVNGPGSKQIAVIDTKTQKTTGHYTISCEAGGLAYASKSNLLIAECDDDGLAVIVDGSTGKTLASVPIGHGADSVQYDAKDQLAMIPCQEEGKLYILSVADPKHVTVVQELATAKGTRTGAWDERNDRGYYMAGQATDQRVHGHLVLQQGTLEVLVAAK